MLMLSSKTFKRKPDTLLKDVSEFVLCSEPTNRICDRYNLQDSGPNLNCNRASPET